SVSVPLNSRGGLAAQGGRHRLRRFHERVVLDADQPLLRLLQRSPGRKHHHHKNDELTSFPAYAWSKTLAEKELLRYNEQETRALEVVSLVCGLVGGDTIQPYLWSSLPVIVSPLTGSEPHHNSLLFLQALLGSVPVVHLEDVCEAHAFCMDQPAMADRFLCAAGDPTMRDIVDRFVAKYPDLKIRLEDVTGEGVRVPVDTSKLVELGFRYKFGVDETLDCSVECAKRLGEL
ncbi:hypothetical protein EJB05_36013, partial [Eragrostis curvula]